MNNKHKFPQDFDPHHAVYALKGLADFAFEYYTEGDGIYRTVPAGNHIKLVGLSWLNQRVAGELVDYFKALDEAGHRLPGDSEEDEVEGVREEAAPYVVRLAATPG